MTITDRDREADSPRINVSFLGREYAGANGAQTFSVTSTLTNIYDGWTVDLPVGPSGIGEDIPALNLHRWLPVKLTHSDPLVDNGKPVPMLQGVCTRVEHSTSDGPSVLRLSGFDLGKLMDSCVRPWVRFRGLNLEGIINKLIDPSWLAKNRSDAWGIQGVRGLNGDRTTKLGQKLNPDAARIRLEYNKPYGTILPPVQTEVGETFYDLVSRYARLSGITNSTGAFVNCSADGWIQIFNPDESKDDPPLYVFDDHNDTRNFRVKRSSLVLDGEDLYSDYSVYGSVIAPPQQFSKDKITNPNAGRFFANDFFSILGPSENRINRILTTSDPEQYTPAFAAARVKWRRRQSLFREELIRLTIQGHCMPGPDGQWRPIVEGNMCTLNSSRLRRYGVYLIEQVVKRQADAPTGTEADVMLRLPGLLGA